MFKSAAVAALSVLTVAGAALGAVPVRAQQLPGQAGPEVKLFAVQNSFTVQAPSGAAYVDLGIYLASLKASLQFDVQRASYTQPVTITQVTGRATRPWPAWTLDGFNGLRKFFSMRVQNGQGKVLSSKLVTFCPDGYTQRVTPASTPASPYPPVCGQSDPFPLSQVWGVQQGWATDPTGYFYFNGPVWPLGTYYVTESVTAPYRKLLGMSIADATAKVKFSVVKGKGSHGQHQPRPAPSAPARPAAGVPLMLHPPRSVLPDLVALPSWGISLSQTAARPGRPSVATVSFGATIWTGGNGPLDVEGFRDSSSLTMAAYQYFWRGNKVIGRAPAGTMGFDSQHGHHHWHFQQFARYQLLNAAKTTVLRSRKVGFCIGPTEGINLLIPHADWNPAFVGSFTCAQQNAVWVQEILSVGWGDTYVQTVAGQAFDVTNLPNGTYYIQITANPDGLLYETTTADNTSLREIILGGTPGHRTIQVPPWHGLDPGGR